MIHPVLRTGILEWGLEKWADALSSIQEVLTSPLSEFAPGVWTLIQTVNEVLVGVAIGLVAVFAAMQAVHAVSSLVELKRPEVAVKVFVRFIITKTLVTHGLTLITELFDAAQTITTGIFTIGAASSPFEDGIDAIETIATTDVGFWNGILLWVVCLIGGLAIAFCTVQLMLAVYGRFFKIYMHVTFAPLALSTFAAQPMADIGKGYLKSFVAVCLEGACIAVACIIYNHLAFVDVGSLASSIPPGTEITESIVRDIMLDYIFNVVFQMLVLVGAVRLVETVTVRMFGLH